MFKKQWKQVTCLGLVAGLMLSGGGQTAANAQVMPDEIISVQSVNERIVKSELSISKSRANIDAVVFGTRDCSRISARVVLQKYEQATKKWRKVRKWEKTVEKSTFTFHEDYELHDRGVYRVKVVATVTRDGKDETTTKYSAMKEY